MDLKTPRPGRFLSPTFLDVFMLGSARLPDGQGVETKLKFYALKNNQLARRYERDACTNGSTYVRLSAVETNLRLRFL